MKRITMSVLTVVVLFLTFFSVDAKSSNLISDNDIRYEVSLKLLSQLGYTNDISADDKISRGEYAKIIAYLLRCENEKSYDNVYFYDIDTETSFVNILAARGIFKGDGSGYFRPNEYVTYNEVIISMVRLLGYEPYVSASGNSLTDYYSIAKKIGITKNGDTVNQEITKKELYTYLYRLFDEPLYEVSGISGSNISYSANSDNTILSVYHDIYIIEGIVTSNGFTTTKRNGITNISDNQLEINDDIYTITDKTLADLIGQNVIGFYHESDGVDEILFLHPDETENETFTIEASTVVSFDNNVLKYYDEKYKVRSIKIPSGISVIYNGKTLVDDFSDYFEIESGTITLYKANNDYNVIKIEEYIDTVVTYRDDLNLAIETDNENLGKLSFKDSDIYAEFYSAESGKKLTFYEVVIGDVLSVARSTDGMYNKIYVAGKNDVGEVKSIQYEEDEAVIDIAGISYKVSSKIDLNTISPGDKIRFIVNNFGKIAKITKVNNDGVLYGLIYAGGSIDEPFEERFRVKLFSEDGIHEALELNEKVKVDGKRLSAISAFRALTDARGNVARQLVRYRTNSEGLIIEIDVCSNFAEEREGENTLYEMTDGITTAMYRTGLKLLWPRYVLVPDTVCFIVPDSNEEINDKNIGVVKYKAQYPFGDDGNYSVRCFKNVDDRPYVDALMVIRSMTITAYAPVMAVDDIRQELIGDDVKTVVTGYVGINGSEYNVNTVYVNDECDFSSVQEGDLIQYTTDNNGEIAVAKVIYDLDKNISSSNDYVTEYKIGQIDINPGNSNKYLISFLKNDKMARQVEFPLSKHIVVVDTKLRSGRIDVLDAVALKELTDREPDMYNKAFVSGTDNATYNVVIYK